MKTCYLVFICSVCSFTFISCHCKTCTDNITEANKKIIYNNKDVIAFKNDTLGIIYDNITVIKGNISNESYDCVLSSGDGELKKMFIIVRNRLFKQIFVTNSAIS
jgi:hypothetical protein